MRRTGLECLTPYYSAAPRHIIIGAGLPRTHLASGVDCCGSCSVARRHQEVWHERERYRDENDAVEELSKGRGKRNGEVYRLAQGAENADMDKHRRLIITESPTSMRRYAPLTLHVADDATTPWSELRKTLHEHILAVSVSVVVVVVVAAAVVLAVVL